MDVPPWNKIGMDWVQSHCKEKPPHIWQILAHFSCGIASDYFQISYYLWNISLNPLYQYKETLTIKLRGVLAKMLHAVLVQYSSFWEDVWVRSRELVMVRKMRIGIVLSCEFDDRQGVETWCSNRERCESDLLRKIRHTYTAVQR